MVIRETFDTAFFRIDSILLLGSECLEASSHRLSFPVPAAETVYYHMFAVIGVGIIFLCLAGQRSKAMAMAEIAFYWPTYFPQSVLPFGQLPVRSSSARTTPYTSLATRLLFLNNNLPFNQQRVSGRTG